MIYWLFFGGLAVVFTISIVISTVAYRKQQAIFKLKSQTRQIKRKIEEFSEILGTLLRTDPSFELVTVIQQQIVSLYEKLAGIDPNDNNHQHHLDLERLKQTQFKSGKRQQPISQALETDTEIESVNIHINTLTHFINSAYKKGRISQSKFTDLVHHLQKLRLDIEVASHTLQANKYLENNDRVLAQSHLKQAKEALRSSSLEFPEKTQQIRELTEHIKSVMRSVVDFESAPPVKPEQPTETPLKKKF